MKKITSILILFICLVYSKTSEASHAVGADLTYLYVGPNQYRITVKFYRDCTGITAPQTVSIVYESASCGMTGNVTISQIAGTGQEIPTGQYLPCYITSCAGGTGYGVEEYIYRGLVTLPGACADWVLSTEINARNPLITTLTNPGASTLRVEATLDNLNNAIDTSPVFSTYPVSRFCINNTFHFNQGATDAEGDSLVFSFVDALDG